MGRWGFWGRLHIYPHPKSLSLRARDFGNPKWLELWGIGEASVDEAGERG